MATYDVSGIEIDGERIILSGGRLEAPDSGRAGWTVRLEGAHMLKPEPRQRARIKVMTGDGQVFLGEAMLSSPGNRDHATDIYHGTEFQGLGGLESR